MLTIDYFSIYRNKEASENNKKEIDKILMSIRALEEKSCECEDQLSDHLANIEAIRMNMNLANSRSKLFKETLDEHKKMIDDLMAQAADVPVITSDGGVDPNQLNKMYASRSVMDDLLERVRSLEAGQAEHSGSIQDIYNRLEGLRNWVEEKCTPIETMQYDISNILDNLNKGTPVVAAPQPAASKDSSQDVHRLNEMVYALKNDMKMKLNIKDFDDFKRDLKMNELDRINRIIEELR